MATRLYQILDEIGLRTAEIAAAHGDWPCRKGCDDCCRHLASVPRITGGEWRLLAGAMEALPAGTRDSVRQHIRDSARQSRPIVCPLLDCDSGTCLVYDARPAACRAYGFYAEREYVLGCGRIESISRESPEIVWGNHQALEERMSQPGASAELFTWL